MNTKNIVFTVVFILLSYYGFGQVNQLDSLRESIEKSKDDTNKVNNLLILGKKYTESNPEFAIHFANQAKDLASHLGFKKGMALALKNIGIVYYIKANYIDAINYWQQALDIYDSIGDKNGVANIQSNLGAIYFNQGEDLKANEYYFKALKTAEEIHDTIRIETTLNNIAAVYQDKGITQKNALEYYLKALRLEEIFKDTVKSKIEDNISLLGATTVGIGEYYFDYYTDKFNLYKKNLSSAHDTTSILDTALYYFGKSLVAYKNTVDEPYTLNAIGRVYMEKKEFNKAINYQQQAVDLSKKFEEKNEEAISLLYLAQTYQKKGDSKLALSTFSEAEKIAKETDEVYSYKLKEIYEGEAKEYAKMRDYVNAYKYQLLLLGIKDTLYNIDQDKKLQGVEFKFDIQKKEDQINFMTKDATIREQEISRQKLIRNEFIGGFAIVLLFAGIFFNQRNKISKEKKRSDELLLNILPSETAEELKATGTTKTKSFDLVTVMFTDFKNFTQASEKLTPEELVKEINYCYSEFDKIVTRHGIEKIKTIGDSYMCAGGLPVTNETHPFDVVKAGIEMQQFILNNKKERIAKGQPYFELRLGIHSGPVVAGIVGIKKFAYDIWGSTVNTASRMESSGEIGKVNISGTTYQLVKDKFQCIYRGKIEAKNTGMIDMYFVELI